MNEPLVVTAVIAVLFAVMAFRALRSGSATDYLLAGMQCAGILLLLSDYRVLACYLLLATSVAYLLSQIVTGARVASRLLPVAGAAAILFSLLR